MLLCVAGGKSVDFPSNRLQGCSSQSVLVDEQVMVEERLSSAVDVSNDHVATLSLRLRAPGPKESSVACRSKVIVVSGDDSALNASGEDAFSTNTTFKSNFVNGTRNINTILVRYKPSKPTEAEDELQFEFSPRSNVSSNSSTTSSDSSSKKDKASTSAWAQIMELEGYRSPAIGLDNGPTKYDKLIKISDNDSDGNSSFQTPNNKYPTPDLNLHRNKITKQHSNLYKEQFDFDEVVISCEDQNFRHDVLECDNVNLSTSSRLEETTQIDKKTTNQSIDECCFNYDYNQIQTVSVKSKCPIPYLYGDNIPKDYLFMDSLNLLNDTSNTNKVKPSMLRSQSSRASKIHVHERNKSRRKTLPDRNLSLHSLSSSLPNNQVPTKDQRSPEHDPNASWGRYNSRAMRDSVRKVAEKYAETVNLRRQTRSKLDYLPETKGNQLSRYVSPFNEYSHLPKQSYLPNESHCPKRTSITSHLHEIPHETESTLRRNSLHLKMPISVPHNHHEVYVKNAIKMNPLSLQTVLVKVNQTQGKQKSLHGINNPVTNCTDLVSLNTSSGTILKNNQCIEKSEVSSSDSSEYASFSQNFIDNGHQTLLSHAHIYETLSLSSTKKLDKNLSSIECKIAKDKTSSHVHLSARMQDVKSKLCADCAQSTDAGLPKKQSSCRSKQSLSDTCSSNAPTSQVSLVKISPVNDEGDFSQSCVCPLLSKKQVQSAKDSRKCTMLTAREMAELVHGTSSDKGEDSKVNQSSVTSIVTSWIQKHKDKRKPVFFIGDSSFFIGNPSDMNHGFKNGGRMSRRSLSLSSVREPEVSSNTNGLVDGQWSSSRLRLNSEDKTNEHKGLFIKRASSSCGKRGSVCGKERQGSPVDEGGKVSKSLFYHRNQVDGCIASWSNRLQSKIKNHWPCYSGKTVFDSQSISSQNAHNTQDTIETQLNDSFCATSSDPYVRQSETCLKVDSDILSVNPKQLIKNGVSEYNDSIASSLLKNSDTKHSYLVVAPQKRDIKDWDQPERSSVSKKLSHFKQINRALSLHSLKKKSKESPNQSSLSTNCDINVDTSSNFSKWTRGSKRKIENLKYGRKSLSYCELKARKEQASTLIDTPLNILPETKTRILSRKPPRKSTCSCSFLRRSASLSWHFPINKTQEYAVEDPNRDILAKICFSRLHSRNTVLTSTKINAFTPHNRDQGLRDTSECHPLDYRDSCIFNQSTIVNHDIDRESNKKRTLNVKEESQKSCATMGFDRDSVINSSNIVDESLPSDSSDKLKSRNCIPMNKGNISIVLRTKTSQSERFAKRKSALELWGRNMSKDSSEKSEIKKRPSSQFYDAEEFVLNADDKCNLGKISNVVSSSQPALCDIDQTSNIPQTSGLITKHLQLHTSTPQLTSANGLLQRFRKSFAVRFKKKSETAKSQSPRTFKLSTKQYPGNASNHVLATEKKINKMEHSYMPSTNANISQTLVTNSQDSKRNNFQNLHKELQHTCSTDKRRYKMKSNFQASPFCDSIDNIFDPSIKLSVDKGHLDEKHDVNKTVLDSTNSTENQKHLTSLDQIWRANPVKLCKVHSRLLMCRHKGRYRLRRSISQPVELEMTGSIHNLREASHGSADHENFQKGSLSSEDEVSSESDIYHSYCCSPTRRSNTCWELSVEGNVYAEALWDHETLDSEELPFQSGDVIEVTDTSDQDWWWGTKDGMSGWFPSAFVRLYVSNGDPALHFNGQQSEGIQVPYSPCKVNIHNLSCEQVRANIVQEIVATERDYVKHLKDVVEGYLKQVHRRPDMFSKERIETVFGNIKEIFLFQSQFLVQLEECLDKESPHLSQIGNCFLNHKEEFKMYSQYCNNHPLAVSELQELYCDSQYIHFFEACRLLQEMIDISLDGFLLTPIQRICKYPLQLAELLKFTDVDHPDHVPVTNALAAMKEVAELVNERKRRMECLERIAEWQSTIEGWEGPDVLDTSSILIHCGEVTRVSSSWSRDIYLFIFDHQLIYCKKDLLKRHTYAYKGRLHLDHCDIIDVEDGKDSQFTVNVKNAWKIYSKDKDKWYLFYAKTSPEKDQWLCAFKSERQRVSDDETQAFIVTEEAKRSARLAVQNKQKPKRPRAKFTKGRRCHPDVAVTELLLDSPSAKSRSGSLPSNIHPELAIMAGSKLGPTRKKGSGWFHFGSGKKTKS